MNNEELKKKILEIVWKAWKEPVPCTAERKFERIADALIAAGIGDVKEVEKGYRDAIFLAVKSQTMTSERSRYIELNKNIAEHRAKVAERALDLCETAYILSLNYRATEGISGQAIASDLGVHKFFMEQAEKELAEEGKDEQS